MEELERIKGGMADLLYQEGFRPYTACAEVAKRILSLEVYKGYAIRDLIEKGVIPVEGQSLPETPFNYEDECREFTSYSRSQQDMLKANFIKVDPRGDQ